MHIGCDKMQLLMYYLLEAAKKTEDDPWYLKIIKKIGDEVNDLIKDFKDFFFVIKKNTYDVLVEKFGSTGVSIVFIMAFIIVIMLIATRIIRGKGD